MQKVSVIIPTYKRSDKIIRAINSVLNQTYKNVEIIVVDDNDENSEYRKKNEEKLKDLIERKKIIYLKHKKNKNGAAARNTGLKKCTGDFITFLDDDDFFMEDRIEKLVQLLNENRDYNIAYSSVAFFKKGKLFAINEAKKKGNLQLDFLMQKSVIGTGSNMFMRSEVIKNTGLFDERFLRHQDIEYMIRTQRKYLMIPINEVLVAKCVDDNSNVPNYEKMISTKELFIKTFIDDINKYDNNIKNDIYFVNYMELIYLFPEKFKQIITMISKYKKITIIQKIIIVVKCYLKKICFIKNIKFEIQCLKYKNKRLQYKKYH